MNNLYPVFLKLRTKQCVVVGGGSVAFRKVKVLLDVEADITVISPDISLPMKNIIQKRKITFFNREFRPGDLDNAFLVIAATDNATVNHRVWEEANKQNILVNVVDVPERCNFYVPSVIRDDNLVVAISTNGKAPYLAKRLRQRLTDYLQQFNYNEIIDQADQKKQQLKQQFPDDIQKREKNIKAFIDQLIGQL